MPTNALEPLEAEVLNKLLSGEHTVLVSLRAQLAGLTVKSRELTGAGFFTEFSIREGLPPAQMAKIRFGDVEATIGGLRNGAGFLLYVDGGFLTMLEGYSYEEPWPEKIDDFSVAYLDPSRKSALASLS